MLTLVVVLFVICLSRMSPKKAKTSRQSGEEEACGGQGSQTTIEEKSEE
jgi:hypothetical protein